MKKFILYSLLFIICAMPAMAADNGCNGDYDYINPDIALCSAHAYNIGHNVNPDNESDRALMNEVVALKTTIATQQMKKQYDFLETTVKRLKTQLEKSILTAKLQAAGAVDDDNSSGASGNRNIVLSNAEDCRVKTSSSAMLQCLQSNLAAVRMAIGGGNTGDANRQLKKDIDVFAMINDNKDVSKCPKTLSSARATMEACIDNLNIEIMRKLEELNKKQTNQNYMMGGGQG